MVWIYGAVLTVSLVYLLFSIFAGDIAEISGDVDLDLNADGAEARGLGCSVIAAFFAGLGSIGVLGSLSGWETFFTLLTGLAFGLIFGRSTLGVLRFVMRQQSNDLMTTESLIGAQARITVDTPAGKVGEALVEADSLIKYPVQATSDDIALKKGDYVEVVNVQNGRLFVKKKREYQGE
ncbi:MAG: hypothetical protein OHK0046_12640 [Anaerolineae bacterium]